MNKKTILVVFALAILGLFTFSFVSANISGFSMDGFGKIGSAISDFWTQYASGQVSEGFVKLLLFFLVAAVIYMVIEGVFPDYPALILIISAVVGFLSTVYFTPSQVLSLMLSYEGLGLAVSTLIPLVVLAVLTYRSVGVAGSNQGYVVVLFQYIAWGAFAIFMIFRLLFAIFDSSKTYSFYDILPVMIVTIGAALIFLFNRRLRRMLMSHTDRLVAEQADRTTAAATRQTRRQADAEAATGGAGDEYTFTATGTARRGGRRRRR